MINNPLIFREKNDNWIVEDNLSNFIFISNIYFRDYNECR